MNVYMISKLIGRLLAICLLSTVALSLQSADWKLEKNKQWPSFIEDRVYDIAISGDRAYLAHGVRGLVVWDISDVRNPIEISVHPLSGSAHYLHLADQRLFVGTHTGDMSVNLDGMSEIRLYDVSSEIPVELGRVENRFHQSAIAGIGNVLLFAARNGSLMAIDFTDPSQPTIRAIRNPKIQIVYDVAVSGSRGFIASGAGLHILDLSNPFSPDILATYTEGNNYFYLVEAKGDRVFTNTPGNLGLKLQEIDISDLNQLHDVWDADVKSFAGPLEIALSDSFMAVSGHVSDVYLFDIANGALVPDALGVVLPAVKAGGMAFSKDTLWVADELRQLTWIDISDPLNPEIIGTHGIKSEPRKSLQIGSLVYEIDDFRGFTIYEIQASGALMVRGELKQANGFFTDFEIRDQMAYLTDVRGNLETVDLHDVNAPTVMDSIDLGIRYATGLDLSGDFAFVAAASDGLHIVDVELPDNLAFIADFPVNSSLGALDVKVRDGIAVLATGNEGIQLVDVSDPYLPKEMSRLSLEPGWSQNERIDISGDLVVVSGSSAHLVDISQPDRPRRIGSIRSKGLVEAVSIHDDQVALGFHESTGYRVAIHNLATQEMITEVYLGVNSERGVFGEVSFDENGLLVAHANYGLIQFKLEQQVAILRITISQDGVPELHLPNNEGRKFEILASENLKSWQRIGIHDGSLGNVFRDTNGINGNQRYYSLGANTD